MKISFSHNWNNKLSEQQRVFSTIRRGTPDKTRYYKSSVGRSFQIFLDNKFCGSARLIKVDVTSFRKIPFSLLALDTGLSNPTEIVGLFDNFGLHKDDDALVLIFERDREEDIPF